jgi:hypothetical protein
MNAPPPMEDVRPFIDVSHRLAKAGLSAPILYASDSEKGFLLLEDLGDALFSTVLRGDASCEQALYQCAVEALLHIQNTCDIGGLKSYDSEVYLREVALFSDWFLPQIVGAQQAAALRNTWLHLWAEVLSNHSLKQTCLVHRDYHADNLLWLNDREGIQRVGMLDYQDALAGDPTYDLVSLLEDARRDVSANTVAACLDFYCTQIGDDRAEFQRAYDLLGAQRNAKIIGIFSRLALRDRKPQYLSYLPRVWGHFMRDISSPELKTIREFIDAHVPNAWRGAYTPDYAIQGLVA